MAIFTCYVPTSNFSGGFPPAFNFTYADGSAFELDSPQFYELFGGSFGYYGDGTPNGYVYTYGVYNYSNTLTRFWDADGGLYDATAIYDLKDTGSWGDFFEYMFYLNDTIYGSSGNDRLDGYRGNDFLDGYQGNDKLKGGPGFDTFFFAAFDGRDVLKDFSVRKELDLARLRPGSGHGRCLRGGLHLPARGHPRLRQRGDQDQRHDN